MGTPRVFRATRGRLVAGVARGLAVHLRWPVWLVRVLFVLLALSGGAGIVLYAVYWAVIPLAPEPLRATVSGREPQVAVPGSGATAEVPEAGAEPAEEDQGRDLGRLLALAALLVGVLLLLPLLGVDIATSLVLPLALAGVGAALVWRQADDVQRDRWRTSAAGAATDAARTTARAGWWRAAAGVVLVVAGLLALLAGRTGLGEAMRGLAAGLVLMLGVGVVAFPWLYRQGRELADERRARIRSEERAEVAAHVHDSVLQTLTLIQRHVDDPDTVARLARREERALRSWLYAPIGDPARTLAAALQREAADVETAYAATIEVVTVGDAPLDPGTGALVAAAREAMVNAAKHGGGAASVYAEASDDAVEVFVRDRGPGFDPGTVPDDRLGVRESILGRMERNGGRAVVRSGAGGVGTEVSLWMPRTRDPGVRPDEAAQQPQDVRGTREDGA